MIVPGEPAGLPATDAAVIEQSWAEPERFEAIFRRYFGRIHQYLAARVGGKIADDLAADVFTAALVGVAGVTFLVKAGGGLYWLIPAVVASLLGGVVNAWLFLVKVTG